MNTIKISVKGKWIDVPALQYEQSTIVITGKWIRIARIHDEAWLEAELRDPPRCLELLRRAESRADMFTFTQIPPGRQPEYEYQSEPDSVAVARLVSFRDWWEGLPQETRKNVRRAEKRGVRVEVKEFGDELVKSLVEVNNSTRVRQGRPYMHYGKSFDQVKNDYSCFAERSDFLCAYFESEVIGFLKVVYRGKVASIINLCTKENHQDKRPSNALIKVAIERCFAKDISHLIYGSFNYGNKRDSPITHFKTRHGFEEILVPRYFVPLTMRGRLYMRVGFHRGMLGMLPNRVIRAGITVRAKAYQFSEWLISRCSSMIERPNRYRQMGCSNPPAGSKS